MHTAGAVALTLLALGAVATAPTRPDGLEHHSGTVVTIDPLRDVIVIDDMGAWDAATEQARITRRRIHITALTEFKVFVRRTMPGGYRGDFTGMPLRVMHIAAGDTVTAECVRAGEALVAVNIIAADVP